MAGRKMPALVEREPFAIIGLVYEGPLSDTDSIARLWHNWERRVGEIQPKSRDNLAFGVFHSTPTQARAGEVTYRAGSPVTQEAGVPDGMQRLDVPGGTFAMLTHRGFMGGLSDTYQALFQWIGRQGLVPDDRPGYELYDERFNPESPDNAIDLYVPVKA